MRERWHTWVPGIAVLLIAVACWTAPQAGFVYDDHSQVVENQLIRTPQGLAKALVSDAWAFKAEGGPARINYYRPGFVLWMGVHAPMPAPR